LYSTYIRQDDNFTDPPLEITMIALFYPSYPCTINF
jgi:hypothetical protein